MPHPEAPPPTCMSCGRDLTPGQRVLGIPQYPKHGVPEDIDCCTRCWSRVPVHERLKINIMLRDRGPDGVIRFVAALVHQGLFKDLQQADESDE